MGLPFSSMPSNVDESYDPALEPKKITEELAIRKVKKILLDFKDKKPLWVCGADTLIALDGEIYGKPLNRDDAARMIHAFKGKTHEVISAVALYNGKKDAIDCRSSVSTVTFSPLSDGEVEWYLDSGEWEGAAGAYKIQGLASCLISGMNGSYSSIVGLPLREFYVMLRDNGYSYGG